jgi:hypothetical protein
VLQRECLVTAGLWCIAMFLAQRPRCPMSVNRPRLGFLTWDQDAAAIFRETGDRHSEGMALDNLGLALREARRFDEAISAHQDAAAIYRETGDQHREGMALNNLESARAAVVGLLRRG